MASKYQETYPLLFEAEMDAKHAARLYAEELATTFPVGVQVQVNHHHGQYTGTVVGHQAYFHRVAVRNNRSGKTTFRYPSCTDINGRPSIELLEDATP